MGVGIRVLELGARADVPGRLASRLARAARAQFPGGLGVRVEEVHHQTWGLVLANRPAASRPPLARGRGKMTRKFGALEENCASGEPSGGEGPEESARRSLPGGADPTRGKSRNALPVRP